MFDIVEKLSECFLVEADDTVEVCPQGVFLGRRRSDYCTKLPVHFILTTWTASQHSANQPGTF